MGKRREEKISVVCSDCKAGKILTRRSVQISVNKYGEYRCHRCITSGSSPKWRDKEWLAAQIDLGRGIDEIALEAGCRISCISKWTKIFGLKFDIYSKLRKTGKWDNPSWLEQQHWKKQRSIGEIASQINLSKCRLLKRFEYYGIPTRDNSDATRLNAPIISQNMKKAWRNPKYRDAWMKARCEMWQDPEYRGKHSKLMADRWLDPQYREQMTLQSNRLHQDPAYVKKRLNSLRGKNKSILEDIFAYFLDEVNFKYERHVLLGEGTKIKEFDFRLEDGRIIEIDGLFPKAKNNDKFKNGLYKDLGLDLIRIPEEVFHGLDLFEEFCKILGIKFQPIELDKKQLTIESIKVRECKSFFRLYHYKHNCGRYGKSFAIKDGDAIVCAALVCHPIREESATTMGFQGKEVREIGRFAISPRYKIKNLGSWMISRIIKYYRKNHPEIRAIISFADPAIGHTGALYKASGMKYVGQAPMDYWYSDPEDPKGMVVPKKTLYNRAIKAGLKEAEYAILHGLTRYYYQGKLKFVKLL